jgi:aryl-alcohol dehydrogenase-like predicted oxidoreductase
LDNNNQSLVLGTALWGWSIHKKDCFALLDRFYEEGFRKVDVATNYPINQNSKFFRYAENLLKSWIISNKINDIKLIIKVGSLDNMGTPENDLSYSFLLDSYNYYIDKFGDNLDNFMLHWDNRGSESQVRETLDAFKSIRENKLSLGLSGIKYPNIYSLISEELGLNYMIEIKHNLFFSAYQHYKPFHKKARFLAYGINAGGVNINNNYNSDSSVQLRNIHTDTFQKKWVKWQEIINSTKNASDITLESFNHLGMINAYNDPNISGIIIGPSKLEQIKDTLNFFKLLEQVDTTRFYQQIKNIDLCG